MQITILPNMTEVWQKTINWQPSQLQESQFQILYELILQGNQKLNLTRITEAIEFWEKHLWDSIRGIANLLQNSPENPMQTLRVIDIGTGAGFPGIPIAITLPNSSITLLDSTKKKINFVASIINNLELDNVTTLIGRVEEIGHDKQHRESYDIALLRAVAPASVCAEYALPLLKINGLAILYRGHWTEDETIDLRKAVKKLGGVVESIESFTTPVSESVRNCLYLRKIATTPIEFPRAVGVPVQQPL